MSLIPQFTITQPTSCSEATFTETTGNGVGGYGDSGNPLYSDVANTRLEIILPNKTEVVIDKNYLPSQAASPNGTFVYTPAEIGYNKFPSGVWDATFKVYVDAIASGSIAQNVEYIVTGSGYSIEYNGVVYVENEIFIGTAETDYTVVTGSGTVNRLEAEGKCNILFRCAVKECLKNAMLKRCESPCDCKEDFNEAISLLVIDYEASVIAFGAGNYKCANDTLIRLEKVCSSICGDCGC